MEGTVRFGSCVGIYRGDDVVDSDDDHPAGQAAVFTNPVAASPTVQDCGLKGKKRFYTADGKPYYYDPVTGQSTWELGEDDLLIQSSRDSSLAGVTFDDFMDNNRTVDQRSLLDEDEVHGGVCFADFIERENRNTATGSDSADIDAYLEELENEKSPSTHDSPQFSHPTKSMSISARPLSTDDSSEDSDSIPSYLLADIPQQNQTVFGTDDTLLSEPFLSGDCRELDEDELLGGPTDTNQHSNTIPDMDEIDLLGTPDDIAPLSERQQEEDLLAGISTTCSSSSSLSLGTPLKSNSPLGKERSSKVTRRYRPPFKSHHSPSFERELADLLDRDSPEQKQSKQHDSLTDSQRERAMEDELLAGLEMSPTTPLTTTTITTDDPSESYPSPPTHIKKATAKLQNQRRDFEQQVAREKALEDERKAEILREQQKLEEQRRELELLKEQQEIQKQKQTAQLEAQRKEIEEQKQKLKEQEERQQNELRAQEQKGKESAEAQQQLLWDQQQQFEQSLNLQRQQLIAEQEKTRQLNLKKEEEIHSQIAAKQKELSAQEKLLKQHQQEFVTKIETDKETAERQYQQQQREIEKLKKAQREEHERLRKDILNQQHQLAIEKKNVADRQNQLLEQQASQEQVYAERKSELQQQEEKLNKERESLQRQLSTDPGHQQLESELQEKETQLKQQQQLLQSEQEEALRQTQLLQQEIDTETSQLQLQEAELGSQLDASSPTKTPTKTIFRKKPPPHAILTDADPSFYAYRQRIRKEIEAKKPPAPKKPDVPKTPIKCIVKKLGGKLGKEWNKRQLIMTEYGIVLHDEGLGGGNRKFLCMQSVKKITAHATEEAALQITTSTSAKPTSIKFTSKQECVTFSNTLTLLRKLYSPQVFDPITEFGEAVKYWPSIRGFYCYKMHASFSSKTWIPKYIQSDGLTLSLSKRKGGEPERSFNVTTIQYCGIPEASEVGEAEPQFFSRLSLVIQHEDKNLYLAFESTAQRDKYMAFINDAVFQISDTDRIPISAVIKKDKRKASDAANNWMSKNWSPEQWKKWEHDSLEKWSEDVMYDIALYTDTIDEPFISDSEDEDDWPKKPDSEKEKHPKRGSTVLTTAYYKKNSKGRLGLPFAKASELKVTGTGPECGLEQSGVRIPTGGRVVAIGPNKLPVSTLADYELVLSRHSQEDQIHYYPPPVDEEYFYSPDYQTILCCPLTLGLVAPSPMPACLELTPEEVRDQLRKERQERRSQEDVLHKEQQIKRQQTAEEATERLDAAAAKASFVAHAAKGAVLGALRRGKQKASDKYRETLAYQITKRYSERFPELRTTYDDEPLCNYKCVMNLHGYNNSSSRSQDSHILLTRTHICYCSGGKANESYRGWIPLADVVSLQYGKKIIDDDLLTTYVTIDWTRHDTTGSDCLQVFTKSNHRYDFVKIRVINIEKKEAVQGVGAVDGLLSYIDNAWRDLVPYPEYEYKDF